MVGVVGWLQDLLGALREEMRDAISKYAAPSTSLACVLPQPVLDTKEYLEHILEHAEDVPADLKWIVSIDEPHPASAPAPASQIKRAPSAPSTSTSSSAVERTAHSSAASPSFLRRLGSALGL